MGANAIQVVGPLLDALKRYDERCEPPTHNILGDPTLTPTHIEGGGPLNQIPDSCTVSFDHRPVPPETSDAFFASLESYLEQWLPDVYEFKLRPAYSDSPDPDAFATDSEGPIAHADREYIALSEIAAASEAVQSTVEAILS